MHIHLHAHTYLNPNTHIHTLTHIQTNPNTLTFTHTHIHTYTHTLSRTLTHTRSFQFCWRLKLTLAVNAGLRLVTSPCCLPRVCTWSPPCHFPVLPFPLCLHLQIPSTSLLAGVQLAPIHGLSTSFMLSPGRRARESVQSQSSWTRIPMEHVSPAPAPSAQGPPSQLLLGFAGVQSMVLSPTAPPVSGWQPLHHADLCPLHFPCWGTAIEKVFKSVQSLD